MRFRAVITVLAVGLWLALAATPAAAGGPSPAGAPEGALGSFEGHGDVGSPRLAGSATYNAVSQEYVLTAGGVNLWGTRDELHFAWRRLQGDFILQRARGVPRRGCRPAPQGRGHRPGAPRRRLAVRRRGGARRRPDRRSSTGGRRARTPSRSSRRSRAPTSCSSSAGATPLTMSVARFGEPAPDAARSTELAARRRGLRRPLPVLAQPRRGRAARSSATSASSAPRRDGFVPYRDYIGSRLEILDLRDRPPPGRAALGRALRGAELDDRRRRPHLQHQRPRRGPRAAPPLRPRHPPVDR